jgi:hypothetical protein
VGGTIVRRRATTEALLGQRWNRAEWVELMYAPHASTATTHEMIVDADLPRLRRLRIDSLRLPESLAPPKRLLTVPGLRHLHLALVIDVHSYVATMVRVHDMLTTCGQRLETLHIGGGGYDVNPYVEFRTLRHPLPANHRLALDAYKWPTISMPRLARLAVASSHFAWLSLDAPCIETAQVSESMMCMYVDGTPPAVARALAACEPRLCELKLNLPSVPDDVCVRVLAHLERFRALQRLELDCMNNNIDMIRGAVSRLSSRRVSIKLWPWDPFVGLGKAPEGV